MSFFCAQAGIGAGSGIRGHYVSGSAQAKVHFSGSHSGVVRDTDASIIISQGNITIGSRDRGL